MRFAAALRDAVVNRLNVSLDTLRPEWFAHLTRVGTLEDAWTGIQAAEAAGFHNLKLNTVLIGGLNADEIPDLVKLIRDHAREIRFIELMPMGKCTGWDSNYFISSQKGANMATMISVNM